MQINGSQLTSAFNIRPDNAQNDRARVPVTIDSKPIFDVEDNNQAPPVTPNSTNQQPITTNDSQQARFVRLFATQGEPSSPNTSNLPVIAQQPLPKGVQQYLQISQLLSSTPILVDETV